MNPLHLEEQLLHLPLEAMLMFLEVFSSMGRDHSNIY